MHWKVSFYDNSFAPLAGNAPRFHLNFQAVDPGWQVRPVEGQLDVVQLAHKVCGVGQVLVVEVDGHDVRGVGAGLVLLVGGQEVVGEVGLVSDLGREGGVDVVAVADGQFLAEPARVGLPLVPALASLGPSVGTLLLEVVLELEISLLGGLTSLGQFECKKGVENMD